MSAIGASTPQLSEERVDRIRNGLLTWFAAHARDLPWRQTRDPYAILVSEVMLQQTQVDRVLPYYERFLERFPTVRALAEAPTAEVIRIWAGLGYNRRAVNLQRAARSVIDDYDGVFPSSPDALRKLPGVGAYTAGAIAAFAFEQDVAFLDTNMRRVVGRLAFGSDETAETAVAAVARELVPAGQGWVWNQALIEFGALQCTARRPACIICPLSEVCAAYPTMQSAIAAKRVKSRSITPEKFESTSRYYRGRVVELLRQLPAEDEEGFELTQLGAQVREGFAPGDLPWLRNLVEGLQRDGLVVIAEDSPRYDADMGSPNPGPRVRLP
jgi:A/G-specific adenine glycosylase